MKKAIHYKLLLLVTLLLSLSLMSGCTVARILGDAAFSDEALLKEAIALIEEEKYDEALKLVEPNLQSGSFTLVEMNEVAYQFLMNNKAEEGVYILHIIESR